MKISAVIITYNEEKNIEACLASLEKIADEVVVVDSFSTDKTEEICRKRGAHFYQKTFVDYASQKNYANERASHSWILSIDADERLSVDLRKSFLNLKNENPEPPSSMAFEVSICTSYCGKFIRHGSWYPGVKIRFFNRKNACWTGEFAHEHLQFCSKVDKRCLKGDLLHYSYSSIGEHVLQFNKYTDLTAEEAFRKGKKYSIAACIYKPIWKFFYDYIIHAGFLDGYYGYVVCKNSAFATKIKCFKVRRKQETEPLYALLGDADYRSDKFTGKILIQRTDNLGDVLLTLPLAGLLKEKYPLARIGFMGKAYTKDLIESCPYVEEFIDGDQVQKMEASEAIRFLQNYGAVAVVEVFPDRTLSMYWKKANTPLRIGTSHRWYHFLYCNRRVNFSRKKSNLQEACLNTFLLAPLGIDPCLLPEILRDKLRLDPPKTANNLILEKIEKETSKFTLVIHPFSMGHGKEWGTDLYVKFLSTLSELDFRVFITGSEKEKDRVEQYLVGPLKNTQSNLEVENLAGKTSLKDLLYILYKADAVVASGTGPLHIASAYGTPVIGFYPPLRPIDAGRWAPMGKNAWVLSSPTPCSACSGEQDCSCMRDITPQKVLETLLVLRSFSRK
ncbi:MAG: glycosyltransferase family 9 protein [Bacteroidales bacterium]